MSSRLLGYLLEKSPKNYYGFYVVLWIGLSYGFSGMIGWMVLCIKSCMSAPMYQANVICFERHTCELVPDFFGRQVSRILIIVGESPVVALTGPGKRGL